MQGGASFTHQGIVLVAALVTLVVVWIVIRACMRMMRKVAHYACLS